MCSTWKPDQTATRSDSAIRLSCARIEPTESGQLDPTSAHIFTQVLDERPNPVIGLQELVFPRLLSSRNRRCMERSVYAPAIIGMSSQSEDCGAKTQLPNKPAASGWPWLLRTARISAADRTRSDSRLDDGEGGRHRQQRVVSTL